MNCSFHWLKLMKWLIILSELQELARIAVATDDGNWQRQSSLKYHSNKNCPFIDGLPIKNGDFL